MKILVIRFRQMGDAILTTPLLSTLRKNFPEAEIDYILNERIAPLFEGHPAISEYLPHRMEVVPQLAEMLRPGDTLKSRRER